MSVIRLLSWNIHGARGIRTRRSLPSICRIIESVNPDIVCLQEVHRRLPWGSWQNQPARIASKLGIRTWYMGCLHVGAMGEGLLIGSQFASTVINRLYLPSKGEQRGLLTTELQLSQFQGLTLMCTHWGLTPAERMMQCEAVCVQVNKVNGPLMLCGDFNDGADSPPITGITARTRLFDAFNDNPVLTYPADCPTHRIDYCFASQEISVTSTRVIGTASESDHLALVVDFEMKG